MENLRQTLMALLKDPQKKVDPQWAKAVMEKYPYFTLITALWLSRNGDELDPQTKKMLLTKASIYAADVDAYLSYANAAIGGGLSSFYPPEQERHVSTADAISTFLDNYGGKHPEEDALLERLIFNPIPDYSGVLEVEERAEKERQQRSHHSNKGNASSAKDNASNASSKAPAAGAQSDPTGEYSLCEDGQLGDNLEDSAQGEVQKSEQDKLIDAFISKMAPPSYIQDPMPPEKVPDTSVEVSEPVVSNDTTLRESLAKVYIRKGKYAKAYEIISELNLNFPQKSVYFADQLRYLEKLMLLEQLKGK